MAEYATYDHRPAETRPGNVLGVVGFVCSLLGLFSGGLLSPVGLVLSLVGLGRSPRGFAIAGVVLGVMGTCGGLLVVFIFGAVILAALGIGAAAVFVAMNEPQRTELTIELATIAEAVEAERRETGYLPAALAHLRLQPDALGDPWGKPYTYTFTNEPPGYDVISAGEDGNAGTDDDIALSKLGEVWEKYIELTRDNENDELTFRLGDKRMVLRGDEGITIEADGKTVRLGGGTSQGHVSVENAAAPDGPATSTSVTTQPTTDAATPSTTAPVDAAEPN